MWMAEWYGNDNSKTSRISCMRWWLPISWKLFKQLVSAENFCWYSMKRVVLARGRSPELRVSLFYSLSTSSNRLLNARFVKGNESSEAADGMDRWFDQIWVHNELAFRSNSTWLMNVPIVALGWLGRFTASTVTIAAAVNTVSIITNATAVRTVGLSSVHYPAPRILSIRRNVWVVRTRHEASRTRSTPPASPRALPVRVKHFMITPAQITERTVRTPNHQFSER